MFSARASAQRAEYDTRAIHIYTYSKLTAIKSVNLSVVKSMEQEELTAIKSVNLSVVKNESNV